MKVTCHLIEEPNGYRGLIYNHSGIKVFEVLEPCAEDTEGMMTAAIIKNKWEVLPRERATRRTAPEGE